MEDESGRTFLGYHGTSVLSVPALLRELTLQTGRNFAGTGQLGIGFYVTDNYPVAVEFALVAVRMVGGYPFVVDVHARDFDQLASQEVPPQWWRITDDSPYLTDFDYLTAPIDGYPAARQVKFNPRAYGSVVVEVPR